MRGGDFTGSEREKVVRHISHILIRRPNSSHIMQKIPKNWAKEKKGKTLEYEVMGPGENTADWPLSREKARARGGLK